MMMMHTTRILRSLLAVALAWWVVTSSGRKVDGPYKDGSSCREGLELLRARGYAVSYCEYFVKD